MAQTQAPPARPDAPDEQLQSAFGRSVEEGRTRLGRSWPGLLATGFVGGADVSVGVLALLVVEHETGSALLGALAFTIGFIALTLGRSELFTENFLVPVTAVIARDARVSSLLRLWSATFAANLVAAWLLTWIMMAALPELHGTAVTLAGPYTQLPAGRAFLLAVLGGAVITLMTWTERSSESEFGRLLAAVGIGFLLVAVPLNHVVVSAVEFFAALHAGAPFGYADWARIAALGAVGNMAGGLGLVTLLRLVQVGGERIREERRNEAPPEAGAA